MFVKKDGKHTSAASVLLYVNVMGSRPMACLSVRAISLHIVAPYMTFNWRKGYGHVQNKCLILLRLLGGQSAFKRLLFEKLVVGRVETFIRHSVIPISFTIVFAKSKQLCIR